MAVASSELATRKAVASSTFDAGTLPIDFAGPAETLNSISYYKVMTREFSPNLFRGKIVYVGASAQVLQDIHATATTNGEGMPGDEVWANATSTLLRGVPLKDLPAG